MLVTFATIKNQIFLKLLFSTAYECFGKFSNSFDRSKVVNVKILLRSTSKSVVQSSTLCWLESIKKTLFILAISKANNDYKMTSTNILADSTNSSSKLKLAKTSSLTNDKSSFSSTSSRKQQSPRMVKPPSVRGDFYQQAHPHRHSMLSKFHNTHSKF